MDQLTWMVTELQPSETQHRMQREPPHEHNIFQTTPTHRIFVSNMAPLAPKDHGRPPLHPSTISSFSAIPERPSLVSSSSHCRGNHVLTTSLSTVQERRVRFFPFEFIMLIDSSGACQEVQPRDLWYSDGEIVAMRMETIEVAERLARNGSFRGDGDSGIEHFSPKGSQRAACARASATFLVLSEQHRQHSLMISDPNQIARAYDIVSRMCGIKAHRRARLDEMDLKQESSLSKQSEAESLMDSECCVAFPLPLKWIFSALQLKMREARLATPVL